MTTISNSTRRSRFHVLCLSTLFAFASLGANVLISKPVQAAPAGAVKCTITTYYSDSQMTNQVGTYSNCPTEPPKRGLTGRRTKYADSQTFDSGDIRGGLHNPDPGNKQKLPCEFLQAGCSNLPKQHH